MKTCGECEFWLGPHTGGHDCCAKSFYDALRKKWSRRQGSCWITVNPTDRACGEWEPKEAE